MIQHTRKLGRDLNLLSTSLRHPFKEDNIFTILLLLSIYVKSDIEKVIYKENFK